MQMWVAGIFASAGSLAPAQTQERITLPAAVVTVLAEPGPLPEGTAFQVVDAGTGLEIAGAKVRLTTPSKTATDGSHLLPRGQSWFEVEAEGYFLRRDSIDAKQANQRARVRVPLLPRATWVTIRIEPPLPYEVAVAADVAAAPPHPRTAQCDDQGRCALAMNPARGGLAIDVRAPGFSTRTQLVLDPGSSGSRDALPHRGVPVVKATASVVWGKAQRTITRYGPRFARRPVVAPQPDDAWWKALAGGLEWLARHQDDDGAWSSAEFMKHDARGDPCNGAGDPLYDVGVTGLALLAFLADGNTPDRGRYATSVRRGVAWLLQQRREDNIVRTEKGNEYSSTFIYEHCIATIALCEAVGLADQPESRSLVQQVVDYLEKHRNPYGLWRYAKQNVDNDMSVTLWGTQALAAARDFGFTIEPKALAYADSYVLELTDANGRTGYVTKGGLSARQAGQHEIDFPVTMVEAMTAAGLLVRFFAAPARADLPATSLRILTKRPPVWQWSPAGTPKGSPIDFYYWALGAQAAWLGGGETWKVWSAAMADAIVKRQRTDGNFRGSWDPIDAWGMVGGRVYATAMLVLALAAPVRYERPGPASAQPR